MAQGETLKELIEQSGQGDHRSFRALIERIEDQLFGYIHARVRSRDDALDTLQDVLVDVWRALPRFVYRSDPEFHGFVYTIAKRRLQSVWNRRTEVSLPDEVVDPSADRPVERILVEDALGTLDDTAREIVVLHHFSRYSFAEIGVMLGMEEGAVRVRHHRALKTLHDSLTEHAS